MNLYRIVDGILSRKEKNGKITSSHLEDAILSIPLGSNPSEKVVPVTDQYVLDTNDPALIENYKNHLQALTRDALKKGTVQEFRLIREDDCFPYDWMWRVNSNQTAREYAKSQLAYSLRMAEARKRVADKKQKEALSYGFDFPGYADDENREASLLETHFGQVYEPTKFRSTKHFTINTPLPYTGSYNQVSSGRRFVVIDKPDLFCKSGYGYSADYQDAYLDVTHEPLAISKDAIVLIPESQYSEIVKDPLIQEQLSQRKVILYRGDEATAVNMVLVQEGVLPYRAGGVYREFDPKLEEIMIQSMKDFCSEHNLDYAHGHGNMFGQGGHFSDLLDSENHSRNAFEQELLSFLQKALPEYAGLITTTFYRFPDKIIRSIDHTKVLGAVEQYNQWAHQEENRARKEYDFHRSQISPEDHALFVETIRLIRSYFEAHSYGENGQLYQSLLSFFHSSSVEEQKEAAYKIQNILLEDTKHY